MRFPQDNCVANYKLPNDVETAISVDYSSELDLFATLDSEEGVFLWSPQNQKIVAHIEKDWDGMCDMLFLPNKYLAISEGEPNHGADIRIISLEDVEEPVSFEIDHRSLPLDYPGSMALCSDGDLLISEAFGANICKIQIDFENSKVQDEESKDVWTCEQAEDLGIEAICCSKNWNVCCTSYDDPSFSCVDVSFSETGDVVLSNEQCMITEYVINGEIKEFEDIVGLAHDGENILVATRCGVVLLESAAPKSAAHLIASNISPQQIRLNGKDQLMVCDDSKFIKVYDYKRSSNLQELCRNQINSIIDQGRRQREICNLPIPQILKNYLLYKT